MWILSSSFMGSARDSVSNPEVKSHAAGSSGITRSRRGALHDCLKLHAQARQAGHKGVDQAHEGFTQGVDDAHQQYRQGVDQAAKTGAKAVSGER